STNPAATPANKTINALKGRNAIILAPSPKGDQTCAKLVELMQRELNRVGAPIDLVQKLPSPVSKSATESLMKSVDLIVATGSQNNVRNAYSSGTPAIGVGAGNVVSIVDETANVDDAASKIVVSKSFDNATSCSSENNLIIVESQYDAMIAALAKHGALLLSDAQKRTLQSVMWQQGKLNQAVIARNANEILDRAGLGVVVDALPRILLVEETAWGSHAPFSGEKLSPVLTVYRAQDFDDARQIAEGIMEYQGKGHSISIHTQDAQRPMQIGLEMPVCRVIVNQIHCYATGGSFDNGLPFSLSMGCGTWGENSISDNMNYRHYLNTTRISTAIERREPTDETIFGDYWTRFDCRPH
ncbi:MAG: aldehyde dehydrogenase family protein, partial [Pseudomonadota bacterium]